MFFVTVHEQNRDKRLRGNSVNLRDSNQDVLLSVPNFLKRLVAIAFDDINCTSFFLLNGNLRQTCDCCTVFADEQPAYRARNSEIDAWTERIDREANESVFEEQANTDDLATFVGGLSVPNAHADEPTRNALAAQPRIPIFFLQKSLQISFALIDHVEVIYVIGLFLVVRAKFATLVSASPTCDACRHLAFA